MSIAPRPISLALVAASFVCALFPSLASARHSWGKYHWAHNSATARLPLNVGNNLSGTAWGGSILQNYALQPWNAGCTGDLVGQPPDTCLGAQPAGTAGTIASRVTLEEVAGGKLPDCGAITGRVEACNAAYGDNGWLGIAQIWVSRNHIRQGVMKLNDTYFNTDKYNKPEWRKLVICQELGHTFGLDHQDENFSNPNLGTCMDYTEYPLNDPANVAPNYHDFEQLALIYNHNDTAGGGGSGKGGKGNSGIPPATYENLNDRAKWGVLRRETNNGRTALYERDLGDGHRLFTFVIWAK